MARPRSARCYGVARPREGSRQNSIEDEPISGIRLSDWLHRKAHDETAPRFPFTSATRVREGAAGQAVVCPLLRGSSPTRGVAPKQHRGAPRFPFTSATLRARGRCWPGRDLPVATG
jgi:hypothetical protein